jgi:predicted nucleotidyltransferase
VSVTALSTEIREKRAQILRVSAAHGADNVRVFGSVVRGDAGSESDIDLLVDFEPGRSLLDHAALQMELEALLGRRVDVASARGLRPRIRDRVLREARPL